MKGYLVIGPSVLSFLQGPEPPVQIEVADLPVEILIPQIKLGLSVSPMAVSQDEWGVSAEGASYLLGSGIPGREGNAVIYGHNDNHLLGPIRWLEVGSLITVINGKEEEFVYQVVETKTVSPKEVAVLAPTEDATLTLYTCTGFWDRERFVVVAKLQAEAD